MTLALRWALIAMVLMVMACGPNTPSGGDSGRTAPASAPAAAGTKAIVIGLDEDLTNLWDAIQGGGGTGARELANVVNQHLVAIKNDGSPTPRLLAELPSIERGTWRVQPDGRMETTFKLRPDIFWHDGTAFTGEDLVFSWQVGRDPEVPNANQEALKLIERMEVVDPTTVVASWSQAYPYADRLEHRELYPLPRHLLEQQYRDTKEAFLNQPYFNREFVGVGPYRIARWESGSHLELTAFDRYFMGRPKIDSVRVQFITDSNTMLANLRSRTLNAMVTLGSAPDFEAMMGLKREWEADRHGTVVMDPISYRFFETQQYHSPYPADLTDPRVRQALMLAIDRPELARVAFGEFGTVADSWVHPSFTTYSQLQDAITRHPRDVRRAAGLLAEAGWRAGGDGILEKGGQRFTLATRDADGERDTVILSAQWKEVGVVANYEPRNAAALRDRQDRATFTGGEVSSNPMGQAAVTRRSATYNIPTAENRWTGTNRGGYSNPAWDALDQRMLAALDDRSRLDVEREMLRLYTNELWLLPLYFRNDLVPTGGGLTGVVANTGTAHRGFILHTWNIHEWDMTARRS
jgi:peptide/nickel transport system substrate-binding protein